MPPLLSFLLLACGADPVDDVGVTASDDGPTWYADVMPVVESRCLSCHQEGSYASFLPLSTYEQVASAKDLVAAVVAERRMPPWKAAEGCSVYDYDLSLSQEEIDQIVAWAEAGAPEGDPAEAPATFWEDGPTGLSRTDFTIAMEAPFTPQDSPDEYRCFLYEWPTTTTFLTGYEVNVGNKAVVHHVVVYVASPELVADYRALDEADEGAGYSCFGGPGVVSEESADWLGGWAPGAVAGDFPEGTGVYVEEGSAVIVQMHYNTSSAGPEPDQSSFSIKVDPLVEHPGIIQPWADPAWLDSELMEIPANTEGVSHGFSYTFGSDYLIWTANLHMHQLGSSAELVIDKADGSEDCMLRIDDWDFNWQRTYRFTDPKEISAGDAIRIGCTWDNPTDETIYWGEGTGDEMCLGSFLITLP